MIFLTESNSILNFEIHWGTFSQYPEDEIDSKWFVQIYAPPEKNGEFYEGHVIFEHHDREKCVNLLDCIFDAVADGVTIFSVPHWDTGEKYTLGDINEDPTEKMLVRCRDNYIFYDKIEVINPEIIHGKHSLVFRGKITGYYGETDIIQRAHLGYVSLDSESKMHKLLGIFMMYFDKELQSINIPELTDNLDNDENLAKYSV